MLTPEDFCLWLSARLDADVKSVKLLEVKNKLKKVKFTKNENSEKFFERGINLHDEDEENFLDY